ncbi:MAG: Ig-like domain-containing protein, partial [Candidatus Marinimicrobia bacterium]|nr:Ig-like domain-containing protein [Candidatus Neomarinimicrobiota bacterium]
MSLLKKSLSFLFIFSVAYSQQITGLSEWNIFLDPGHSQSENMGIYNYSEANKNLRVAQNLKQLLETNTDIDTVYLSRINDTESVDLSTRTTMANNLGASWFHSIHSDAGAATSNSTLLLWGQYNDGREKVPNGGHAMSDIMIGNLTSGMRTTSGGSIGDCSFYTWSTWCAESGGPYLAVNRGSAMASELSEAGFHTNPKQNQLNMNAEWKRLEAYTFYWSILQYHGIAIPPVGICAGIVSDIESAVPINGAVVKINGQTYTTDSYASLFNKYSTDSTQLHNGFFFFENLPNDSLVITASAANYESDTVKIFIKDNFFTFNDFTLVSTIPPTVASTTPANGDTTFIVGNNLIVNFSRPMDKTSVEANFKLDPPAAGTFKWKNSDQQLLFGTDSLEDLTSYTLTLGALTQDRYGHFIDGNKDGIGGDSLEIAFRTNKDLTAPKLLSAFPTSSATNVDLQPIISFTFNELLADTSVHAATVKLKRYSDGTYQAGTIVHYQVGEKSVLTFFPTQKLNVNEVYTTYLAAGLTDVYGNKTTSTRAYSFRTMTTDLQVTNIESFDSGVGNWMSPTGSGSTTGILAEATSVAQNTVYLNPLSNSAKSMQLNYGWNLAVSEWLIREYLQSGTPRNITFDQSSILQVYVFGDGSGNQFRFAVDENYPIEAPTSHEVSPWITIDWLGWKLISWDVTNDGTGAWLGDGTVTGTLRFDSIQLTYVTDAKTGGSLYFDDLRAVKKVAV